MAALSAATLRASRADGQRGSATIRHAKASAFTLVEAAYDAYISRFDGALKLFILVQNGTDDAERVVASRATNDVQIGVRGSLSSKER